MITRQDHQIEKEISNLVGAMCDPTIVWPGYEDSVPKRLKNLVPLHRLIAVMKHEETATDAEAAIYLSTASLAFPFNETWTQIYLYAAYQALGDDIPKDIQVREITEYQKREYAHFKDWLYRTRVRERKRKQMALESKPEHANARTQEAQPQMALPGIYEGF